MLPLIVLRRLDCVLEPMAPPHSVDVIYVERARRAALGGEGAFGASRHHRAELLLSAHRKTQKGPDAVRAF